MTNGESTLDTERYSRSDRPATLGAATIVRRSLWMDAIRRFRRNRLAMLGLILIVSLIIVALFADVIAPYPYDKADFSIVRLLPFKDPAHLLGGDLIGRDYLTRLIYGARTSLFVGLSVPLITFSIGIVLGALAGYRGGLFDFLTQRIIEVATALPPLIFALILLSIAGPGVGNVILVLSITGWIESARLTRAQFLANREKEFVTAARALGATDRQIIFSHILPNAFSPLLIAFTFAVPLVIFAEAGLSFLGLGIAEPTASWGKMVGSSIGSTIRVYYHLPLFPTILVALTMLGFSFVGDGLQEALDVTRSQ
ncbi:MAG: ABC transporter permease [Anaerolineae bacterium]|nr:ABC transporter permease [Anaerolineae bacterium]